VCPHFVAHSKAITSVCVYSGHKGNILSKAIDPFLVTGSEDHSARIWSMVNCTCLRTLNRHIFDVTAVAVFLPLATRDNDPRKQRALTQRQVLATTETAVDDAAHQYVGPVDPIIVTGGMDDTIRMWQYSTGLVVDALTDIKCHITCLAYFTIPASDDAVVSGTVLAAGDGNGTIWLWSGRCPYQQVACLKGHVDEVRSLSSYSAEGEHVTVGTVRMCR
jgi:WD40 repeat protein